MSKSHASCSCIQEKPQETGPLTVDYDLKNIVKLMYFLPSIVALSVPLVLSIPFDIVSNIKFCRNSL